MPIITNQLVTQWWGVFEDGVLAAASLDLGSPSLCKARPTRSSRWKDRVSFPDEVGRRRE